ncbi:MAG: flagellar basal body P-ring formation chaperone FlgA [Phycisphaerales bacterium]
MNTTSILRTLALLVATLACCCGAFAQITTTVDVRSSITLPAGSPVLLKQIATLAGPDADRLESVVVLHADQATAADSDASRTISRDQLREILDTAGANWARTLLRAKSVTITFTASAATSAVPAPAANVNVPQANPLANQSSSPSKPADPRALRFVLLKALADAAGLQGDASAITLRIDALPLPDQDLLAAPVPAHWRCSVQVLGATPSGRTPIKIEAFDGDRVALSKTITVEALVRRDVLVIASAGGIAKDQVIAATDVRTETRAIPVNESARLASITMDQVVGAAAKRRIDAGKAVTPGDLAVAKATVVVRRGDDVWVSCLSGGMMIKTKAKSLGTARDGETVQLQLEGSKRVVTARMSGVGKAVIDLDGTKQTASN